MMSAVSTESSCERSWKKRRISGSTRVYTTSASSWAACSRMSPASWVVRTSEKWALRTLASNCSNVAVNTRSAVSPVPSDTTNTTFLRLSTWEAYSESGR